MDGPAGCRIRIEGQGYLCHVVSLFFDGLTQLTELVVIPELRVHARTYGDLR